MAKCNILLAARPEAVDDFKKVLQNANDRGNVTLLHAVSLCVPIDTTMCVSLPTSIKTHL
jgi:hypothetical protein